MTSTFARSGHAPSSSLLGHLRDELVRAAPFAQMTSAHVEQFIAAAQQVYFAPGETVFAPDSGVVAQLMFVRQGSVTGRRGGRASDEAFLVEAGELFPVGAVMGARSVTSTYEANEDLSCLQVPVAEVRRLVGQSAVFADFLNATLATILELSHRALQQTYAARMMAEHSLEAPLGRLPAKAPAAVGPASPLSEALVIMHERRIGSVLVIDDAGAALGILTRHDIVGRISLPQRSLQTPIAEVMSAPVHSLDVAATAQEAALLMSRHGIRHVPVTAQGRVVSIVSERDLFALQRLSLKQVGTTIRAVQDVDALRLAAIEIRKLARHLLGQGVRARQLTELISRLNDVLTERLVQLVAASHGLDLRRACWLSFGSEGRGEQTIATDQDNGLVFDSDDAVRDRPAWLAFAREVNEALDVCGFPLCEGNVMASNPDCCLTTDEWLARLANWLANGAPQDALNASIYFDLRGLAGNVALAAPLRELIVEQAARLPRFIKQLARHALSRGAPLNWRGAIDTREEQGRQVVDLKLQGTAIFVDAARLYALAHGVRDTGTRARFAAVALALKTTPQESEGWISAFEFLQMLRLQVQLDGESREAVDAADGNPNLVEVAALNDIDRRVLKASLRIAHGLQQRMRLDSER